MSQSISSEQHDFPGFPEQRANVTFVPLQFFTVVLPHLSRGCVRLVGFMIRRLLGWVDVAGNPIQEQLEFTCRELSAGAGISRDALREALAEAQTLRLIECGQAPRPHLPGRSAQRGVYRLRWSDTYTNNPDAFDGFFRREAMATMDQGSAVAKAARKNIPNAFFDYVLRRERLAVARVVGAMLFRSIGWGPGGERRVPVCLSISQLARLTQLSRHHAHEAVVDALARGYIERVNPGRFDPVAGRNSEAATYRIRWTPAAVTPVYSLPPAPAGASGQKGERHRTEKVNGERAEIGNHISIKRSIKTNTAAGARSPGDAPGGVAAAEEVIAKLKESGFDHPTAARLAQDHPQDVILRQLEWLPRRCATKNRLGLLRSAIEGDWPKPEAQSPAGRPPLGAAFARAYESAFYRTSAELVPPCSPKEAEHAELFVRRLDPGATEAVAAGWGTQFGVFARSRNPEERWLVKSLRVLGDDFVRQTEQRAVLSRHHSESQAQIDREAASHAAHQAYLRECETQCRTENPSLYAEFEAQRDDIAARLKLSERTRALLASETSRLTAFADFLRDRQIPVREFADWIRSQGSQAHTPS